jgi:hypothetical protein
MPTTGYDTDPKRPHRNWSTKGLGFNGRVSNLKVKKVAPLPGLTTEEIAKRVKYGRY